MMLTKFTMLAVLAITSTMAAPEKIRFVMRGIKRDASHIANYYLPAHHSSHQQYHQLSHGGNSGGLANAQHLQVLDVKLPTSSHGHYIPSYAVPSKSYESTAHHFPIHTPQFSHTGQQYALNSGHSGKFGELSNILGNQGSSASGHVSFGGQSSSSGHGASVAAAPSYSYSSQSFGHQGAAALTGHQSVAQGGYSFASAPQLAVSQEASKAGPLSFGDSSQSSGYGQQQQQQPQAQAFTGHQFGFIAGGGHEQQQHQQFQQVQQVQQIQQQHVAAPQISYIPQSFTTSSHSLGQSQGPAQTTPIYAVGMKGLGHYATGGSIGAGSSYGHGAASSFGQSAGASFGHGASSFGHSSGASLGHGLSLGHSLGGLTYGSGANGGYYLDTSALKGLNLDTSALKGLNLGGKFVIMSKPTALTYGQGYSHQYPKYTNIASFPSSGSAGLSSAGGYKSAAPFKPSVFLGATQENVSEYEHSNYGQEASSSGFSTGSDYKFASSPSASYGSSGSHH